VIRERRKLFGFHLLICLIARLSVGSIGQMPPYPIYDWFAIWGIVIFGHSVLLAILDGRDHAELPHPALNRLIEPRERRWSLFIIDAAVWIIFTMAIASRVIPESMILQYVVPLSLLWLAHTAFGLLHVLLLIYAKVRDHTVGKRKNAPAAKHINPLLTDDDSELIDFPESGLEVKHKRNT
jgi:hypothetical protein